MAVQTLPGALLSVPLQLGDVTALRQKAFSHCMLHFFFCSEEDSQGFLPFFQEESPKEGKPRICLLESPMSEASIKAKNLLSVSLFLNLQVASCCHTLRVNPF